MSSSTGGSRTDAGSRARAAIRAAGPVRGLAARSPVHRLDRRRLRAGAVVAQSLGSIAPAAVASAAPAAAIAMSSGAGAVLAAALALVVAVAVASVVNTFTRRLTAPGSLYTFAVHGLGPRGGGLVGCALLLGYAGIAAACIAGASHYLTQAVRGGIIVTTIIALTVVAVVVAVTRRGTRSVWPLLLGAEIVSVVLVVAASAVLLGGAGEPAPPAPVPADPAASASLLLIGIVAAIAISASGFVGFESGTALGPEARRPFLVVPRVVRWTPVLSGAVLIVATTAQAVALQRSGLDPALLTSPLPQLLAAQGAPDAWTVALDLAIGTSFITGALASVTALTRLVFAVGLDGVLPAASTRVHPRYRTPTVALWAAMPVVGGVPVVAIAAGTPIRGLLDTLIAIGVMGYMLSYLGVAVAAPRFLRRIGESTSARRIAAGITAGVLTALVISYTASQILTGNVLSVSIVLLAGIAAVFLVETTLVRSPAGAARLGVFDATSAEDVLAAPPEDRTPAA
jgi:amino acid transporter